MRWQRQLSRSKQSQRVTYPRLRVEGLAHGLLPIHLLLRQPPFEEASVPALSIVSLKLFDSFDWECPIPNRSSLYDPWNPSPFSFMTERSLHLETARVFDEVYSSSRGLLDRTDADQEIEKGGGVEVHVIHQVNRIFCCLEHICPDQLTVIRER